jgi:hypothetical protein
VPALINSKHEIHKVKGGSASFTKLNQTHHCFYIILFPCLFMLQEQPDGSRQQDGGISATAAAHQHSEREIMNRFTAE